MLYRFRQNGGQWPDAVRFQADVPNGRLFVEDHQLSYVFIDGSALAQLHPAPRANLFGTMPAHVLRVRFEGAQVGARPVGQKPFAETENWFIGPDPARWAPGVRLYPTLHTANLYPGIDLQLLGQDGRLKYEFDLKPGAQPNQIRMVYSGANRLRLLDGQLEITTSVNVLVEEAPVAWQTIQGRKHELRCRFVLLNDSTVGFTFPDGYDPAHPLTIDPPVLIFSTYTGATSDNWGFTATYDGAGSAYSGGIIAGPGFPVTASGPQPISYDFTFNGGIGNASQQVSLNYSCDISIIKFDSTGSQRLYSTYLGGANGNEQPHSLIVNQNGELYILGTTRSNDFPTTPGAYDRTFNGPYSPDVSFGDIDIIVSRLSANGSQLLASTYVGGSGVDGINRRDSPLYSFYADDARGEIILDAASNPIIVTNTSSSDFPTTAGAFQTQFGGQQDAAVFKMNANLSALLWSTFFGGTGFDSGYSINIAQDGSFVFCGGTTQGVPFTNTSNVWRPSFGGGTADGYVVKLSANGQTLEQGTYIGTAAYDQAYFVDLDENENIYITGQTRGNLPVVNSPFNNTPYGNLSGGQYIVKLPPNLSSPVFLARFGSGTNQLNITPTAFLVDVCENIYVAGWGSNTQLLNSGSTLGLPVTPDAYKNQTDGSDFYVFVLAKNADSLLYATFFGGPQAAEHVDGGTSRFDKRGVVYQSVCASCGGFNDFPTAGTPGPYSAINGFSSQQTGGFGNCNNAVFKFRLDISNPVLAEFDTLLTATVSGCAPYTFQFTNQSQNALEYEWDFGDGATSTAENPVHTFTQAGTYNVTLKAINPNRCNGQNIKILPVQVFEPAIPDFSALALPCSTRVNFTNTSQKATSYLWQFGTGATSTETNPSYVYPSPGSYTVTLIVNPGTLCSSSISRQVVVGADPVAGFSFTPPACALSVPFTNTSQNSQTYFWSFGNGQTSTATNPTATYTQPGTYTVRLIAGLNSPCPDTLTQTLTILPRAQALFSVPGANCTRTVTFTNASTNATAYAWSFGNGQTSTATNPTVTFPASGTYTVTLTANPNGGSCSDSYTQVIRIPQLPIADFETPPPSCNPVITFTNTSFDANSYYWDFGDGVTSTQPAPTHTYATPGTYQVSLVANPDSLCPDIVVKEVVVVPVSEPLFRFDTTACIRSIFFENRSKFATTYEYDFGDGSPTSTAPSGTHIFPEPGVYTVTLTTNKGTNCEATYSRKVNIRPQPLTDFEARTQECSFRVRFDNRSSQAVSYYWDFGDGATSTAPNPFHDYSRSGTYEVILVANPDSVCVATLAQTITVLGPSTARFSLPDTVVCDGTLRLTNQSQNAYSYLWQFSDGFTSTDTLPTHTLGPGSYSIRLITNPASACPDTATLRVRVVPRPIADFTTEAERCSRTVRFVNTSVQAGQFAWYYNDTLFSTEADPTFTFAQDQDYRIVLIVNRDSVCPDTLSKIVYVGNPVQIGFDLPAVVCDSTAWPVNTTRNARTFVWQYSDGTVYRDSLPPLHRFVGPGDYRLTLIADSGTACERRLTRNVRVPVLPVAAFDLVQERCGPQLTLTNRSTGAVRYEWTIGEEIRTQRPSPIVPELPDGTYDVVLTAFDTYGCTDTAMYRLQYDQSGQAFIFVPNAFTPNGDGTNDEFRVYGQNAECIERVMIFDRWGLKVFESTDYRFSWRGIYRDAAVPEGVYVYRLDLGSGLVKVGTVTVIR
jgi:gliding motility-associated-like protein